MLNRCTFIGNVTRDPESRNAGGADLSSFAIAVNDKWKNRDGVQQEHTEFIDCVAWRGLANVANNYLYKGSKVFVAGKYKTEHWEKDGIKRKTVKLEVREIVLLDKKRDSGGNNSGSTWTPNGGTWTPPDDYSVPGIPDPGDPPF